MFPRLAAPATQNALKRAPAVALLGARQVGKSTLARAIAAETSGTLYLDLEAEEDRARLANPALFLRENRQRLVVLDEVQRAPEIFTALRPEIDADRRAGRFLLLGSASPALLRQTSESLAGRIALVEMRPLLVAEVKPSIAETQTLWMRGGFPESYTSGSDADSFKWRRDFIRTFLERDIPQFGINIPAPVLERFWRMLAHTHGQLLNAAQLAGSMGVSNPTIGRYVDLLAAARVLRRVEPMHRNLGKRLVKSPRLYIADSGLLHALLQIQSLNDLVGHNITGASWEGFVIEQIMGMAPQNADISFYRTAAGAELDLVMQAGQETIGFEVKLSSAPKLTKGFWLACQDVGASRAYVVAPVQEAYRIAENVEVVPVTHGFGLA
jgi:predicted AAA+ superfamily ATPase